MIYIIITDSGYIILVIPDKRFTFDHFREVTPFRDAYDVYLNGEAAAARLIFDGNFNHHPCNSAADYLQGGIGFLSIAKDVERNLGVISQ